MPRILVTGVSGKIGRHLASYFQQHGFEVSGLGRTPLAELPSVHTRTNYYQTDITDMNALDKVFHQVNPEVVIHCAAMSRVEDCERNPGACENVNVDGTANVLVQSDEAGARFIFLSTDFVFDGFRGLNTEDDQLAPVNWYGFTKMHAESLVETNAAPWAIVRTSMVFGGEHDLPALVRQQLERGTHMQLVDDQTRTPTYIHDLVNGMSEIIVTEATGYFHLAGSEVFTPYEIGVAVAERYGLPANLLTDIHYDPSVANRPKHGGLSIEKARTVLGYSPRSFAEALQDMV